MPAQTWPVHSLDRPRPPVVDPGPERPPQPPPSDAIVLFDGKDLSQWQSQDGSPAKWVVRDGYAEVAPGTGAITTKRGFGDMQLHIEWATPTPPKGESQERGNSGVILMTHYEIQVLDSYHNDTYADGQAGAVYGQTPPLVNASGGVRATSHTRTGCPSSCRTTVTRPGTGTSGSGKYRSRIVSLLAAALKAGTVIVTDRALRGLGELLGDYLFPATGLRLAVRTGVPAETQVISIRLDSSLARLGDEGYRLDASPSRVAIRAYRAAGAFYGIGTLRQLLPPAVFRQGEMRGVAWSIPAVAIEDVPRFAWRGVHLDVARHFMPKEFVKKYIELAALHKLNRFHWHLTDDQGWRLEIKQYPRLTQVGAWRRQTIIGRPDKDSTTWRFDGQSHGGFYTQDDIREIVAYARARFVTIVPEIEMPGHSQAAIAAYPELGNRGDTLAVWTAWGVDENILNPADATIQFEQNVLTEVMALFPDRWIHVGGDEAPKTQWKASPLAQTRIRELGLKSEDELQSWFTRRMDEFLTAHGAAWTAASRRQRRGTTW